MEVEITQGKWTLALSNIIEELTASQYKRMLMLLTDLPSGRKESDKETICEVIISHYGLQRSVTVIQEVMRKIPRNDPCMLEMLEPFVSAISNREQQGPVDECDRPPPEKRHKRNKPEKKWTRPDISTSIAEGLQKTDPSLRDEGATRAQLAAYSLSELDQHLENREVCHRYVADLREKLKEEELVKLRCTIQGKKLRWGFICTWERMREICINQRLRKLVEGGCQKDFPFKIVLNYIFENNAKYAKACSGRPASLSQTSACFRSIDDPTQEQGQDRSCPAPSQSARDGVAHINSSLPTEVNVGGKSSTVDQGEAAPSESSRGENPEPSGRSRLSPGRLSTSLGDASLIPATDAKGPSLELWRGDSWEDPQGNCNEPLGTRDPVEIPQLQETTKKKGSLVKRGQRKKPVAREEQQRKMESLREWASANNLLGKRRSEEEEEEMRAVRDRITFVNIRGHRQFPTLVAERCMVFEDPDTGKRRILDIQVPEGDRERQKILNKNQDLTDEFSFKTQFHMGVLGDVCGTDLILPGRVIKTIPYKPRRFKAMLETFVEYMQEAVLPALAVFKEKQQESELF
ncbi:uncharacterized protein LOC136768002 [Amia ocellicauda]|uniref:uncharacterized protein LOC136768002 n=1 Tax=Amia ocellicauda TaxID=2972642 RepID=UPI003463B045